MIPLTTDQAQQIEEAFENAESVAASINAGKHHVIQIDDEKCFWQREEWVRWAIDEVLPEIREALSAIRAARAQEQADQEPVKCVKCNAEVPLYKSGMCEICDFDSDQAEQEPVYAFRRRGLNDFCTCTKERYEELVDKPNLFEVTTFYTAPVSAEAIRARGPNVTQG